MLANLIILMAFSMAGLYTDKNPEMLVDWNHERKLSWNDFKGRPDPQTGNAALTSTSINIDYSYNKREVKYSIRCQFDPTKSWGRVRNNHILAHEQAHFDIAEIHARELYKALKAYRFNASSVNEDIGRIYESVMQMHHAMQSEYDGQTDYSRNSPIQQDWQQRIANALESLKEHANYH
jgi:predicted secreted Zn-dependent protease